MLDKNNIPPEFSMLPVSPEENEKLAKHEITARELGLASFLVLAAGLSIGTEVGEVAEAEMAQPVAEVTTIQYDINHVGTDILHEPIHTSDGKTHDVVNIENIITQESHDSKSSNDNRDNRELRPEIDFTDLVKDLSEEFSVAEEMGENIGNSPVPLDPAKIPATKLPFKITIDTPKDAARQNELV